MVASWNLKRAVSVAVTEQERLQEIGAYLKRMGDADILSGAIVIPRDRKPVFAQASGHADREKKVPNTLAVRRAAASLGTDRQLRRRVRQQGTAGGR